ncbi:ABC transporter substrate-binding protein [Amaricoccus solimangrovi]|uniref:ABC transporter substrate-binding protein n=2 Tax=Amaricoccus solimangrovi TaxID=2589815 RepID=A0A501WSE3_9RHOB|nr:ABC transporter substrate-binding protein [Amaricoccus solimangrovi]
MVGFAAALLGAALLGTAALAETPVLRIAAQKSGTVNWELETIKDQGLDGKNGFDLQVMDVAAGPAGQVAFQGGEADAMVTDWIWVARQRAAGEDYVFIPYSRAVGGLMVPGDSPAKTLADLKGAKIGVAGGPLDKSWILLRAYSQKEYGFDLADQTEQVFGAPPLIAEVAERGEVGGAINFWHFLAKMKVAGMRELIGVSEVAEALGLDPDTPLLGYVVRGELLRDQPELVHGFATASREAKELLASDPAAWDHIRPMMNAADEAQFDALKAGFIAGIPADGPVNEEAAGRMLGLMARIGGDELVGGATTLPKGLFVQPGS